MHKDFSTWRKVWHVKKLQTDLMCSPSTITWQEGHKACYPHLPKEIFGSQFCLQTSAKLGANGLVIELWQAVHRT